MPMRSWVLSVLTLSTLVACGACRSTKQGPADCVLVPDGFGPDGAVPVRAEVVASGLEVPWAIGFLPNGDALITERPGRIRLLEDGQLVTAPVAQLAVRNQGEGGLLGLAVHPEFATNRLFFVYFTSEQRGTAENRVERWQLTEDHRSAAFDRVILEGMPAANVHDGGRLRIGPDGLLYLSLGDAREPSRSQDPSASNGKILRLTLDGEIPADNPFPGSAAWIIGVRNSQGFDWRDDDTMWVVDHGPTGDLGRTGHDEVNVAGRGSNLGWPELIGCETREGRVTPSLTWEGAVPPGGAAIYTGTEIGPWRGSLLVGTLGSRHLHRVAFADDGRTVSTHEVYFRGNPPEGLGRLRDVVMGPDGHLWITTSNCDGRGDCPADGDKVLRVRSASAPSP